MAIHDVNQQDAKKKQVFPLYFRSRKSPCYQAQLEGRIVAAHEGLFKGKKIPVVTLIRVQRTSRFA